MGSTNKTTELELSQFTTSDKPTWLGDYNGDMRKIDIAYGSVKVIGDDAKASAAQAVEAAAQAGVAAQQAVTQASGTLRTEIETARVDALTKANAYTDLAEGRSADAARSIAIEVVNQSGAVAGPLLPFQTAMRTRGATFRVVTVGGDALAATADPLDPGSRFVERLAFRSGATGVEPLATAGTTAGGIRWINGALPGSSSNNYLTPAQVQQIQALNPGIVLHYVGATDYATNVNPAQFENQMRDSVARVEAAMPGALNVLVMPVRREDATGAFPFEQYATALKNVASQKTDTRMYIDLTYLLATRGNRWGVVAANGIDLSRNGHLIVADVLSGYMGIPTEDGIPVETYFQGYTGTFGDKTLAVNTPFKLCQINVRAAPFPRLARVHGSFLASKFDKNGVFVIEAYTAGSSQQPVDKYAISYINTWGSASAFADQKVVDGKVFIPPGVSVDIVSFVRVEGAVAGTMTLQSGGGDRYHHLEIELIPR